MFQPQCRWTSSRAGALTRKWTQILGPNRHGGHGPVRKRTALVLATVRSWVSGHQWSPRLRKDRNPELLPAFLATKPSPRVLGTATRWVAPQPLFPGRSGVRHSFLTRPVMINPTCLQVIRHDLKSEGNYSTLLDSPSRHGAARARRSGPGQLHPTASEGPGSLSRCFSHSAGGLAP